MSAACPICHGSGETRSNGILDCTAPGCNAAVERTELNETIDRHQPEYDLIWAAYLHGKAAALEEAALICDQKGFEFHKTETSYAAGKKFAAFECAEAIRALKP